MKYIQVYATVGPKQGSEYMNECINQRIN